MKSNQSSFRLFFLGLGIFALSIAGNAKAEGESESPQHRFTVMAIGDFYTPSLDSSNTNFSSLTNSANLGFGLGALSEATISGPIGWEFGLLILSRQSTHKNSLVSFNESSYWLSVPIGLKLRFAQYFALGAGGYLNYRVGDVSNKFSVGDSALISFDTDNRSRFEAGVYGTVGATLPINKNVGLVAEVRLMRGLSNLYKDSTADIKSLDILSMVGVQFAY